MESSIIIGRILQKIIDKGICQVEGYNRFVLKSYDAKSITLIRENGKDVRISFSTLKDVIEKYKQNPDDYDLGPSKTRDYGISHINSPVWSMAHLLEKAAYKNFK